jgi:primosomal protein N' (replication factor Y) (superfamily II helicase)
MPLYAEVILPLALPENLSWKIPSELDSSLEVGMRVVVPLGRRLLTGLVASISDHFEGEYDLKEIDTVLDEFPLITSEQLKLWEWMATYYMCSMGEVMSSALPGSLKLSSESKIVIHADYEGQGEGLNDREFQIFDALVIRKKLSFSEVSELLEIKSIHTHIKSLIAKGIIEIEEELRYRYKAKKVDFVRFTDFVQDEEAMHELFDTLEKRAPKQLDLLMHCYRLAGGKGLNQLEIEKKELLELSGNSVAVLKGLQDKGVVEIFSKEANRFQDQNAEMDLDPKLSEDQKRAKDEIARLWEEKEVVLLKGITGSGKTEIYIELIREAISKGKQVLYLLPEIALTAQIIQRLQRYFGDDVGIYHSKFNPNERAEVWYRTLQDNNRKFKVLLGARSAMFLPFHNLGLVIVDEEHESTFKQQDPAPRYNARDMAVIIGKLNGAKVLLGTATPAIESFWNATRSQYGLVELNERYGGVQLPEIFTADIRKELKEKTMRGVFTSMLVEAIKETIEAGEQVILFQNRRGYSPLWQCQVCGWIPECPNCDVSLTYHKRAHLLKCHYCGSNSKPPSTCRACMSSEIKMLGFGTEKIEEELIELFPEIEIARMDLDTTRSKNAYSAMLEDFGRGKYSILVGTQMVTKGLDFGNVGLVGVLNADLMLKFPDFRSFERSYQLMTQVAGRAGRQQKRGKVVIQTYDPDHWVIQRVIANDYEGLYNQEILERRNFHYPPFFRLIRIDVRHRDGDKADRGAMLLASRLKSVFGERVLGPERPYISRINNIHHVHILLKFEREASPTKIKNLVLQTVDSVLEVPDLKGLRIVPDVDPA